MATYTIKSGDTFTAISAHFNMSVEAIQSANSGIKPTELQVGQVINLSVGINYTIASGDTLYGIAKTLNVDIAAVLDLNPGIDPTKLEVGQNIKVPVSGSSQPPPVPPPQVIQPPSPPAQPTSGTYVIVGGDTFTIIASKHNTDATTIQNLNPGINPTTLQIGQTINVPLSQSPPPPSIQLPTNNQGLIHFSGPSSSHPHPQTWSSYSALWTHNSNLMKYNNAPHEITILSNIIPQVSHETGVDARAILCMCMQETGGSVRAPITFSPAPDFIRNTGIMQAHNGATFDEQNVESSIIQMVRDGAGGTSSGDGLRQCLKKCGGDYYEAFRMYNSGTVDRGNLANGITATGDYVSKMANRLCGRVWENM